MAKNGSVICIVLDGVGIGAAPDAHLYHDEQANTLGNTAATTGGLVMPNMAALGLGTIAPIQGVPAQRPSRGNAGRMREVSKGKDSTTGHWEFSGIIMENDFPYYPAGFPKDVVEKFCRLTGCGGILGNSAASGTVIIDQLGEEHARTGYPIVYTSADSVFQIAANEAVIPLERLYELCTIAREQVMVGPHAVGRVIARPFIGTKGNYKRTTNRRDFSLFPPAVTVLDLLQERNIPTIGIGKIDDLFAGKGLSEKIHTKSNAEGIEETIAWTKRTKSGFIFTNLVDFDALFGHRQDAPGMKGALEYFDTQLPRIIDAMKPEDLLIITADHGNDPTDNSTDHSREYVPLVVFSPSGKQNVDLGIRQTFADLGKTVAEYFGAVPNVLKGTSFLDQVM
ncbi:MAG: phosphopentomutase [Bacteroidetes bacterium]|nr:phosphopentomutase [Bacteroidota bacterium]